MEDFASVIWVIIIVGAMVFNVVSQSRKARGKGAKQIPHSEALKTAHETDEIAAHAISDAPEESSSSIAGEFNLRQAVIYSEILKPRFDEE